LFIRFLIFHHGSTYGIRKFLQDIPHILEIAIDIMFFLLAMSIHKLGEFTPVPANRSFFNLGVFFTDRHPHQHAWPTAQIPFQ